MSDNNFFISLSKVGGALGRGLIAGLAGTVAITISQMIEMQLSGRGSSDAPMKVAGKALGVEPRGKAALETAKAEDNNDKQEEKLEEKVEANKEQFSQLMHFAYGTSWGIARGVLDLAGLRGAPASLIHFGTVWGTALLMLPAAGAAKPVTKWPAKQIATDVLHHAVYAAAAGAVYDAMPAGSYGRKRKWNIF
ncbi:hypothetical protein [Cesiribacter sp. SM1]|uniref:hypothetical protein n=1 Tax=Cesiribacter sp. SM1 TaxID=2861196 RepID=UPI001CD4FDF0|nr:hypothetical protein [Cesiribacter sp. SM1]